MTPNHKLTVRSYKTQDGKYVGSLALNRCFLTQVQRCGTLSYIADFRVSFCNVRAKIRNRVPAPNCWQNDWQLSPVRVFTSSIFTANA